MEYDFEKSQEIDPITQWVTFMLEGEKYGINVMQVKEVLRNIEIAPVPGAPDYILGIINLRGNVVTVIDTRKRFALAERELEEESRIIIIETDEQVIGLLVDGIAEVADIPKSEIEITPNVGNDESSRYILGVHSSNGELLILVEIERLLTEDEWADMESF